MRQWFIGIGLILLTACVVARDLPLDLIQLPTGFKIELYADNVPGARSLSMSPDGTLFVGSRHAGKVYAIQDTNQDGRGDKVDVIAQGLDMPNGVAFHDGALYVAEISRIIRFDDIENRLPRPLPAVIVSVDFPTDPHHGWKFIRIGPDEKLYVPIGAPCNICREYGYAVITRLNLDGSQHEIYAEGIRNTVGFDWHPDTRELWFTDNGRDQMGDDLPADELNRAADEGLHFGFPYCHGGEILDPEFGLGHGCNEYVAPVQQLGAHVAALGMRFYTGSMFPPRYQNQVFIAEHGSWNRSNKSGYRISLVSLKGNRAIGYKVFAEGWLQGQDAWGRPVDIEHMADGSLLVSDDKAGVIYRIYYDGSQPVLVPPVDNGEQPVKKTIAPQSVLVPLRQKSVQQKDNISPQTPPFLIDSVKNKSEKIHLPDRKSVKQGRLTTSPESQEKARHKKPIKQTNNKIDNSLTPVVENGQDQVNKQGSFPPVEVIEKIRTRTEQNDAPAVDPFSPVKKQTVN